MNLSRISNSGGPFLKYTSQVESPCGLSPFPAFGVLLDLGERSKKIKDPFSRLLLLQGASKKSEFSENQLLQI